MFCRQTVEVWGGVRPMFSCKVDSSLQLAKKVVSNSPGLVDFAIGLVNSVFNLPDRQVMFFEEFELQRDCETNSARQKAFGAS